MPAERSTNERRDSPVPAGSGAPGSCTGRPRPAAAAASRMKLARLNSRQALDSKRLIGSTRLIVGTGGDQLAQRVLALCQSLVDRLVGRPRHARTRELQKQV